MVENAEIVMFPQGINGRRVAFVGKRDAIIEKTNRIGQQWVKLVSGYCIVHNLLLQN